MKLWLLRPINESTHWRPWFDKAFGFVIRAETEAEARKIAQGAGGDETRNYKSEAWVDPKFSTCTELTAEGAAGEVIQDYRSA